MPLENPTYISDFVDTNPTSADPKSEGDDHIRNMKSAIQTTFPNVTGEVTATHIELSYTTGLISGAQGQLDLKSPIASPTFTGTVTLPASTSIGNVSSTELGYVNGVVGPLQDQMDLKAPKSFPTFTGTVRLPSSTIIGDVSSAEIGYVNGVTSAIQTQLNGKSPYDTPDLGNNKWTSASGFRIMWGTGTSNSSGKEVVNFSPDFGNVETVLVTDIGTSTGSVKTWTTTGLDEAGFDAYVAGGGSGHTFRWVAFGTA